MRAVPLHFTDSLSVGHLCGQLAHPGQTIIIFYRLDRTMKDCTNLAGAYLRTKDFGPQERGTPPPPPTYPTSLTARRSAITLSASPTAGQIHCLETTH